MNHVFAFHPAIVEYVTAKYAHDLQSPTRESVSVHFRLGGGDDPIEYKKVQEDRRFPSPSWYKLVLSKMFLPRSVTFLIFTDNLDRAKTLVTSLALIDSHVIYVDEDFVSSMVLMSLCKHHVGTVSTFSFWGAYLDKKQPYGGKTIFPPSFNAFHGGHIRPYETWELVPDPRNFRKKGHKKPSPI